MSFFSLICIEIKKIRRSKIFLILLAPVILMWLPAIINSGKLTKIQDISITPARNFFIQGFMGMVWFMIPATLIICTVLLTQTERLNHGILKMLSLPVNKGLLCLAKFTVLLILPAIQMFLSMGVYYLSAFIASRMQDYDFALPLSYSLPAIGKFYLAALPAAAVFWMISTLIRTPVFSAGLSLAACIPSVLMINTDYWYLHPMSYPFYVLMTEYGKAAKGVYETSIDWLPWIPAAIIITGVCLIVSCVKFGYKERK